MRDSAGMVIVENSGTGWRPSDAWSLTEAPVLTIGVDDGPPEYQLYRVTSPRRLSNGHIALMNGGTEIRLYDANGTYLRTSGRKGGGPGEYENAFVLISIPGDSLMVFDWRGPRASIVDAQGRFVRSFELSAAGSFAQVRGRLNGGMLVATSGTSYTPGRIISGVVRDSLGLLLLDESGRLIDTVGVLPSADRWVKSSEQMVMVSAVPFGKYALITAAGDRLYYGFPESFEVRVYRVVASGDVEAVSMDSELEPRVRTERIIRRSVDAVAVTQLDIEESKRTRLEGVTDESARRRIEEQYAEMKFPSTMPAFTNLVVDSEGHLWAAESGDTSGAGTKPYSVFGPEGGFLGRVMMPQKLSVSEIGKDYVLGTTRDELDVERVVLYGLRRGAGAEVVPTAATAQ